MQKMMMSRKTKQENSQRLVNLSPEKYGKGAFADLTFTPSKLADNILYREASNLKRIQEESAKNREFQTTSLVLNDQVGYLKKERDGISDSLNQIITMYKGIISEMEIKNDERMKDIQKKFKEEVHRLIIDKEEEAKYFQSEKEILEDAIQQLQSEVEALKNQLNDCRFKNESLLKDIDVLQNQNKRLEEKSHSTENKYKEQFDSIKENYQDLKNRHLHAQVEWKNTLNQEIMKKDKQIQNIERLHRVQFQKLQAQRNNEIILKNQELNELTKVFESQSKRMSDLISARDRVIQQLSAENNKQKTRIINLTRDYEAEINLLAGEKNRLIDEIEHVGKQNEFLAKDKVFISSELQRENMNLRDVLLESSVELEKCKNQFLELAKENTTLLSRLKSAEEEARTWRESYYINKNRGY